MPASRVGSKPFVVIILVLFFAAALYLRVYFPYGQVFTADGIKFTTNDAYYFMRQVDNLVHNFPRHTLVDPYFIYPPDPGTGTVIVRFFAWLLAGIIWVVGLGSPTEHLVDVVSVYYPAVLGALTVIPVYFIGKELFSHWAGVFAAGLIVLLPGEFLGRSMLGSTDHHVAEVLFTTITMLFLILALKTASQKGLTFSHLKRRDWATMRKPLIYSLLAGFFLGIYILTFLGALLFVFLLAAYFIIQFISDHLRHRTTDYLGLVGAITFLVALATSRLIAPDRLYRVSMLVALLIPPVLSGVSRLMTARKIKPAYYPVTIVGLGLVGLAVLYIISPDLVRSMLNAFSVFMPRGTQLATLEMQPILFPSGRFSFGVVWGNFTTSSVFSLVALGILIYLVIRQGNADKTLLVVWSLIILAATLGQRRFAYYFVVNASLLTGYLSWQVLNLGGLKELSAGAVRTGGGSRRAARARRRSSSTAVSYVVLVLAVLVVFFGVFFWNIPPAIATASQASFAPSDGWMSALSWLKENTPEPLGNADAYYALYKPPPAGEEYDYPESFYAVLAWWDYGYWITRIAHRIPDANPSQDQRAVTSVANFFTAQEEEPANEIAQKLASRYIVIDYQTAMSKFHALARWAGREQSEYLDIYWAAQENQVVPVQLYYPEYYRSLSSRLYNFDGKAVTPESTIVISYQDRTDQQGRSFKALTGVQQFPSYAEAEAFLSSQESANYKIVGTNPFISPVPLAALEHYRLIYGSDESVTIQGVGAVPEVKIFEYSD